MAETIVIPSEAARRAAQTRDLSFDDATTGEVPPQRLAPKLALRAGEAIDALLVIAAPFLDTVRDRIVAFAEEDRLPAIYQFREYAVAGGLMSYGISLSDGYRWVGEYAGRLLGGAKPADLPIVQSIKFEFVLNQKTATTLGIDVSPLLLARADEVIE